MENNQNDTDELFDELQKIAEQIDVELAIAEIAEQSLVELKQVEFYPIFDEYYGGKVFEEALEKGAKRPVLRDPKGGLTAAGRAYFKRKEGANLKPGVRGPANTPEKMRRKGSFLTRFFTNPSGPMRDEKGRATRLALSAAAWGEPVPQNMDDARELAAKGRRLLERYQKAKEKKSFVSDLVINKSAMDGSDLAKIDSDMKGLISPSFVSIAEDFVSDNTEEFYRSTAIRNLAMVAPKAAKSQAWIPGDEEEVQRMVVAAKFMKKRRKKKSKSRTKK